MSNNKFFATVTAMPLNFQQAFGRLPATSNVDAWAKRDSSNDPTPVGAPRHQVQKENNQPRIPSNSALAQLKALGPRLTSAQRESIAILEEYNELRAAPQNVKQFNQTDSRKPTGDQRLSLVRRPGFAVPTTVPSDRKVSKHPTGNTGPVELISEEKLDSTKAR